MSKIHDLKIRPEYFKPVLSGKKKFEIRKNDRNFKVGDFLTLREYAENEYTGRREIYKITYILSDPEFLKPGFVALSIERCSCADLRRYYAKRKSEIINKNGGYNNET